MCGRIQQMFNREVDKLPDNFLYFLTDHNLSNFLHHRMDEKNCERSGSEQMTATTPSPLVLRVRFARVFFFL